MNEQYYRKYRKYKHKLKITGGTLKNIVVNSFDGKSNRIQVTDNPTVGEIKQKIKQVGYSHFKLFRSPSEDPLDNDYMEIRDLQGEDIFYILESLINHYMIVNVTKVPFWSNDASNKPKWEWRLFEYDIVEKKPYFINFHKNDEKTYIDLPMSSNYYNEYIISLDQEPIYSYESLEKLYETYRNINIDYIQEHMPYLKDNNGNYYISIKGLDY